MEEQSGNSFIWKTNLHKNTAYPVDYNLSSLKKRDENFKTGFVNRRTWNNPLFQEVFRFVVHPDYIPKEPNGNRPGIVTIPLELETFFYTYLRTHLQYKESHDKIFEYEIDGQPEFHRELCRELYHEITKETMEDSYLSRSLCDNLFWRNTIADDLWENEISKRICRMREQKYHISAEKRLQLLMNIMSFLDQQIMEMTSLTENQQQEYTESFLEAFPLGLIQKTRKLPSKDPITHDACFNVSDIMLEGDNNEIQKLSDAFSALKKDPYNEGIKSITRKAYLDALKKNITQNQFFDMCKRYLDYSCPIPAANAGTALEDIAKKRCIHYFSSIVRGNPYMPGTYAMDQETLELYQCNLQFRHIEDIICKHYNAFIAKEWPTMSMVLSDNYFKLAEAFRINPGAVFKQFTDNAVLVSAGKILAENIIPSIIQVWPQSIPCVVETNFNIEDRQMEKIIPALIERVNQIYVDWGLVDNPNEKKQPVDENTLPKWWEAYCNLYRQEATAENYLVTYLGVQLFLQCLYTIKVSEQVEEIYSQVCSQMKRF